jgi:hypothetical protein
VHHNQGARVQSRRNEISVGRSIDTVGNNSREAQSLSKCGGVDSITRPGHCTRTQWERIRLLPSTVQTSVVPPQGRGMGEKKMRNEHRLRSPQMGVSRHEHISSAFRLISKGRH